MSTVRRILPTVVFRELPRVRPALERMAAASDGCFLAHDIAVALCRDSMQLWLVEAPDLLATLVTEIIVYPRRRALRLVGLVGRHPRKWLHLFDDLLAGARGLGCDRLEALVADDKFQHILPGCAPGHRLYFRTL